MRTQRGATITGSRSAVFASAVTVVLALLTLLAAVLTSNHTLGVSAAIGVVVAPVFGLGVLAIRLATVDIGLPRTEQFRTEAESVRGQEALARHFPVGTSQPVTVVADAGAADRVTAAVEGVAGVVSVSQPERSTDGTLARWRVDLAALAGTPEADRAIRDLRAAVAGEPGALVGGEPAADLDKRDADLREAAEAAPSPAP
ncbi:hypothetical protein [Phytohabitans kaempferiae]|uniref:Uncharacterized protein n=1 Tax=Phytohabitans kaempferiae TaxID=1620943 RepID=A0ABV6MIB8_9ACTN